MRKYVLAMCAVALVFLAPLPASAQNPPARPVVANPQVAAILASFPTGGPGLRAAIATAVEANPSLVYAVLAAAAAANDAQKLAIGAALADAVAFFAKLGTSDGRLAEAVIQSAMKTADSTTAFWFKLASVPTLPLPPPDFAMPNITTNACTTISPSGPGTRHGC